MECGTIGNVRPVGPGPNIPHLALILVPLTDFTSFAAETATQMILEASLIATERKAGVILAFIAAGFISPASAGNDR